MDRTRSRLLELFDLQTKLPRSSVLGLELRSEDVDRRALRDSLGEVVQPCLGAVELRFQPPRPLAPVASDLTRGVTDPARRRAVVSFLLACSFGKEPAEAARRSGLDEETARVAATTFLAVGVRPALP